MGQRQGFGRALRARGREGVRRRHRPRGGARRPRAIIEDGRRRCVAIAPTSRDADEVRARGRACVAAFGRIDILHNNVGIVEVGGPVEITEESWDRTFAST